MMNINCGNCCYPLEENFGLCPKCGSEKKAYSMIANVKIGSAVSTKLSHRRKGYGELQEQINLTKPSINPIYLKGVRENRTINREKGSYDQIVTDVATGIIIHEEHMTLKKHNEGKNQKTN